MSQRTRLPNIPVKHTVVRKVVNFTRPLEAKLHAYIAYYAAQQGFDPKQVPTEADTIVALIESYLDRDVEFNRHLRNRVPSAVAKGAEKKAAPAGTNGHP